ncbi:hypothetical protein [Sorangium sp. So ce1078]|uniref:hypothetical protein n=1 Tax=Sorangium sp. So ce1078 TaxID=3133329 RepID=UPI003F628EB5
MKLTYLGTATLVIRIGETRFLTDPVFDEVGAAYDFGPWFRAGGAPDQALSSSNSPGWP